MSPFQWHRVHKSPFFRGCSKEKKGQREIVDSESGPLSEGVLWLSTRVWGEWMGKYRGDQAAARAPLGLVVMNFK